VSISLPNKYLRLQGHSLEDLIRQKLPQLRRYNQGLRAEMLKVMREYPEIIPVDFIDLYNNILIDGMAQD